MVPHKVPLWLQGPEKVAEASGPLVWCVAGKREVAVEGRSGEEKLQERRAGGGEHGRPVQEAGSACAVGASEVCLQV